MLEGKILTKDVMCRHKMGTDEGCLMCENCPCKSALHLLFLCPNRVGIWSTLAKQTGYRLMVPASTVEEIFAKSKGYAATHGQRTLKEWQSMFAATCCNIWKRRNDKMFAAHLIPAGVIVRKVVHEARM